MSDKQFSIGIKITIILAIICVIAIIIMVFNTLRPTGVTQSVLDDVTTSNNVVDKENV